MQPRRSSNSLNAGSEALRGLQSDSAAGRYSSSSASAAPPTRSRVTPAASSSSSFPRRPAGIGASSSASAASSGGAGDEYDLESLLGWDKSRAATRAREERSLRDRILERDREIDRDRRRLDRLTDHSSQLQEMLATIMSRNAMLGEDEEEAGPVLDESGQVKRFTLSLHCFSFAVVGRTLSQMGDKVILPSEALYQVQKLRLPFPLLFRLENPQRSKSRSAPSSSPSCEYCGVLEFSAPEDHIYLPQWMMENLGLGEGSSVRLTSESGTIPQGKWVKLVPHSVSFSKILRELGPKYFLEMAMRSYSALTKNQRILIEHQGVNYSLDVADTKPADTISLFGNLDLEVEFGVALDAPRDQREAENGVVRGQFHHEAEEDDEDLKRALAMSLAESQNPTSAFEATPSGDTPSISEGKDADEGWAVMKATSPSGKSVMDNSLQARFGGNRLNAASSSSAQSVEQQPSESPQPSPISSVATGDEYSDSEAEEEVKEVDPADIPPNHTICPSCKKPISNASLSLHSMHCARAFVTCDICQRRIKKADADRHKDSHGMETCPDCNEEFQKRKMKKHRTNLCRARPVPCFWCQQMVPLNTRIAHEKDCAQVKEECSVCGQGIPRSEMKDHPNSEGCRVQCGKCDEYVTSRDLVIHTKERCAMRMVECPHCHLNFAYREFAKHRDYCGSRTEQCDKCQRYIKLRDMEQHLSSSCAYPPPEAKPSPSSSPVLGPASDSAANARMNLLSNMLGGRDHIDPAVLSALLSQSVDLEDPLAAAAARNAAASSIRPTRSSAASSSVAQRQANAAREKLSRAMDAADNDSEDVEDALWNASLGRPSSSSRSKPQPRPAVRTSSVTRATPSASAALSGSANRAASVPRGGKFECVYCHDQCASLESLQVHILTECHDKHAAMEQADPAAAAKALEGKVKEIEREHVSINIPVANPVSRASSISINAPRTAAPSSVTVTASASSPFSSSSNVAPFDPYDLSWRKPKRDGTTELLRHTAARKSSSPPAASGSSSLNLADYDLDDDESMMEAARKPPATKVVATKPKLMTSNPKLKATSSATTSTASKRLSSSNLADSDHLSAVSSSSSRVASAPRNPLFSAPLSLKQQQKEIEQSIARRKDEITKRAAAPSSISASPSSISEVDRALKRASLGSSSSASPAAARSSAISAVSLPSSKPKPIAPSVDDTYDSWLAKNFPATAARMNAESAAGSKISSAYAPASPVSSSRGRPAAANAIGAPSSPLTTFLGNARAASQASASSVVPSASSYRSSRVSATPPSPQRPASPPSFQSAKRTPSASRSSIGATSSAVSASSMYDHTPTLHSRPLSLNPPPVSSSAGVNTRVRATATGVRTGSTARAASGTRSTVSSSSLTTAGRR